MALRYFVDQGKFSHGQLAQLADCETHPLGEGVWRRHQVLGSRSSISVSSITVSPASVCIS
jgi:hypothetical protein